MIFIRNIGPHHMTVFKGEMMTLPKNRHAKAQAFLALSCVGSMFAPLSQANAQQAEQEEAQALGGVTVRDSAIDESAVKVEKAESPKYTRPLLDTPQTITVIGSKTLMQQNLLTLREVLSTVPGITFGAGEGGFGYGDRINLRGYSANNDISVDGVRSGAVMNRNETYNIEQVEVTNGANSVFGGSGSVGGSINLVSKRPLADDQIILNGGVGTDNYYRATVDANKRVNDLISVRLNAVFHKNDIPGREVENNKRWGIAPAITFGIEGPTSLTLQYEHLDDQGMPQYGVPYFATRGGFLEEFNREGYYGFRNVDKQDSKTDSIQAIFNHEFSDKLKIRNLTRFENIRQSTVTSQPAGTFCLPSGLTPTGGACTATVRATTPAGQTLTIPGGYFLPTGGRGTGREIHNETAYNQLDLSAEFDTGGIGHTLVFGVSALWEKYAQDNGNVLRTAAGYDPYAAPFVATSATNLTGVNPLYNAGASMGFYYPIANIGSPNEVIAGPAATTGLARVYGNNTYNGPINFIRSARAEGEQTTYAAYLFDTLKFSDFFEINAGLRYENVKGSNRTLNFSTTPGATLGQFTTATGPFKVNDNLFSYRVGAVFKPSADTSIYAAYGNAKTPSKASVDGSCAANNCNVEPETAINYEIGAKADLFDKKLQLSAALFRNQRDKYRVASGDPAVPDQVLDGKSRVDGIALGATGNITNAWSISANYTYLDSKIIRGVSRFCLENPGYTPPGTTTPTCTNSVAFPDASAGTLLPATPKHSGSLFTTYTLPFGLEVGYGISYQGKHALNPTGQNSATPVPVYYVDDYLTHRLMVSYAFTPTLTAQLNVQNLTNEKYETTVRTATGNSWAQPGATRSAVLSVAYTF